MTATAQRESDSEATAERANRRLPIAAAIALIAVLAAGFWWFGVRDTGNAAEPLYGTWLVEDFGAYENFGDEGTWQMKFDPNFVEGVLDSIDWGTYTFDGETLTMHNAEGSYCSGATIVSTVEFSADGQQAYRTFVSDSCTVAGVIRGQDNVIVKQSR